MLRRVSFFAAAAALLAALFSSPASATEAVVTVRGGDVLYSSGGASCRVGFNARDSTTDFGLMAGHCITSGSTWYLDAAHTQPVATSAGSSFPGNDYGIVRYFDTVFAPSVVAMDSRTFTITTARNPVVGEQVCMPGTAGLHCAPITAVNVTVNYGEGTVSGLFAANVCVDPGEKPGPGFSGNAALGIPSGVSGTCASGGTTYFQPVTEVLSAYGLSVG
ncbi:MAG TPA: S1 family peptidase [Streptomyces sp.]|nr:S1 family peptidase [Streptomyces sp.]